jgi:hypothetical protein
MLSGQYTDGVVVGHADFQERGPSYSWGMDRNVSQLGGRCGSRLRRGPSDSELVERVAAGESLRSIGREFGVAHTTLGRRLQCPRMKAALREAKRRRRLEEKQRLALEKEVRARAKVEAARDRQLADQGDGSRRLSSTERRSENDELAAQAVAAGAGIKELIEVTGLRTPKNLLVAIDPQIVDRALKNDRRRPKEKPPAGRYSHFTPDDALIARRVAGEPFRSLAEDADVSHSALCRSFARPEVEAKVQTAKQHLIDEQQRRAAEQARLAALAAHYASKVPHIWCPIHHKRVFVTSIDTSEDQPRLHVSGCCQEAINELLRWLKIYRPTLPEDS